MRKKLLKIAKITFGLKARNILGEGESAGFTLLEVVIAMAIMVIAFTSILAVEQGSLNATARAKQMNIVGMLAKNQMVETEFQIEGKTFDEMKKESTGTFPQPYEDYSWKTEIKELHFPDLGGQGQGNQGEDQYATMITKAIKAFLNKAVRLVTVTVSWRRGSGTQSYTLSTFWVDLNHEFSLSE